MQAEKAAQNLLNEYPVIFLILKVNYYFPELIRYRTDSGS